MRKILHLFLAFSVMLLLLPQAMQAQERTVTGTIVSEDNKTALAGVTVRVKGTRKITQTDANGKFTIKVGPGETLLVTYVGYVTTEVKPGESGTVGISMKTADNMMGEVVVTAMDIKRNPRELGYSVQKVSGADVAETQRENFLNGLGGRVAGLTLNPTSGQAGASTQIVLRGFNSMALDNQPLFVIDGVIMDNSSINESGGGAALGLVETSARNINQTANRNSDYSNRIGDLNPNDIETITVLKGPEATALYGSQASSGAIVITTKKGKTDGKFSVNYDNSFRVSKLTRFPEYTTNWSPGTNGVEENSFTYFGPAYEANTKKYDNVGNFFQTAFTQNHNITAEYGKKNISFRFSGSFLDQQGIVPENAYKRYSLRLTNSTKIGKYIDIAPSITYIHNTNDKPKRGAGGYLLNLMIWPSNDDIRNYLETDGSKKLLYSLSPNSEIDNPYFNVKFNRGYDVTDRYIATMSININPFKWLSVSGRFGYDHFESEGWSFFHPLSFILGKSTGGQQDNYYRKFDGYNHTITATTKKSIGKFNLRLMGGTTWQDNKTQMYSVLGTNIVDSVNSQGQMVKDLQVISQDQINQWMGDSSATKSTSRLRLNRGLLPPGGLFNYSLSRQLAFFGEFSVNYKNLAFFTYSHRFETSSIFPKNYRNYNYPAGSVSFIVSDILPALKKNNILNYMKLRTSLASTARSSSPYANQSVFSNVTSSGGGFAYGFNNNNYFLEPEIQSTHEMGTELRLFNSKIGLDITYYKTTNKKQIAENFRASYGTGYVLNTLNVGSTENKGLEIGIDLNLVTGKSFNWNMRFNFNRMRNKVLELPANVPEFYISDTWVYGNARGGLVTGGPTTAITAYGYARNTAGDILINPANGLPVVDANFKVRGDRNPDLTLGWINNFKYKNWALNFVWDLKVGGDIFNATDMYLTLQGVSKRTDDRYTPRVVKGVLNDGLQNSATPTKNTIVVIPAYNQSYYTTMPEEEFIQKNVNWFRMRDITLRYTFSDRMIRNLGFLKTASVFITANDLILLTNYNGADPVVNGNTSGTRGVGGWGFDYGNVPAPVSVNFGIRAGF
ncbi:MAG: SusC/RagA family TonB-linked outer membrane protein [Sphingobacteriales bacterium]|nr:SusC/RagA family TonB-linked outer membrane protein [Sphingobacteriales bacterium]